MADVLIVDDDADTADALAELLELDGHAVRVAINGAHGLSLLRDRLPDLVVLDVEMPLLDGPAMAARMFVLDSGLEDVPIVLVSGSPALKEIAGQVGTPYFQGKPYAYERLSTLVQRALRERSSPRPQRGGASTAAHAAR